MNSLAGPDLEKLNINAANSELVSQSEIEQLLAQVESVDPSQIQATAASPLGAAIRDAVRRYEFPKLSPFSASELRPLRMRHEDFLTALAARVSIHLGMEVVLQLSKLEAVPFSNFIEGLSDPTYLSLLKLHPLPGTCLLDLPPKLAMCIVDRELGGPGLATEDGRQIGKIEARLLAPVVDLIINEWCAVWKDLVDIRPAVIGSESNCRYLNTCSPRMNMLVVGVQFTLGEMVEQLQLAFPHPAIEPLTARLTASASQGDEGETTSKIARRSWNTLFDNVKIEVTARLPGLDLSARQISELKPGAILPIPSEYWNQVELLLEEHSGFVGRLGLCGDRRAVQIEKRLPG